MKVEPNGMNIFIAETGRQQVSAFDRAVQFGDAHFTTAKIHDGKVCLFDLHKQRLQIASERLQFAAISWQTVWQAMQNEALKKQFGVIKVVISRGESQRGYAGLGCEANVYLFVSDRPQTLLDNMQQGINLEQVEFKLGHQPILAGLKHCNRLEQVLIKNELMQRNLLDGLVFDLNNSLIETSVANIFLFRQGEWQTPLLDKAGINGVLRQHIMNKFKAANQTIKEIEIPQSRLNEVSSAFICNALIGIVPVIKLAGIKMNTTLVEQVKNSVEY